MAGEPAPGPPRSGRLWSALALVLLATAAVRAWPAGDVFGGPNVRLVGDGDAAYHLVRAQRTALEWPHAVWTDPGLDHPRGALIPWPPLFDQLIATIAVLTPGGADPEHVARVAALVPLVLALLTVPLVAALASSLLGGGGLVEALVASLLPAAVHYGWVGLSDHHAAELLLFCALLVAYRRAWAAERADGRAAAAAGVVLALSFWNWPGSGLYLLLLAGHAAANHAVQPEGADAARRVSGAVARVAGAGAAVLAVSIALLGPPGALWSMALVSVSGLSVVMSAAVALGASVLALASRVRRADRGPLSRMGELAVAGLIAVVGLLLVPGLRSGVLHGLTALGAGNGWYRSITEFKAALLSGIFPLPAELVGIVAFYGLAPAALPLAAREIAQRWRRHPADRQALLFLVVWCGAFVVLALARVRFMLYASVPVGICAGLAVRRTAEKVPASWRRAALAAGCAAILAPAYLLTDAPRPAVAAPVRAAAEWLGRATPADPASTGVLAPWALGHALRAAGRPVVSSPFGTDVSRASLEDEAAFFATASAEEAEAVALRRRIGFVVIQQPVTSIASVQDFRPQSVPEPLVHEERSILAGVTRTPAPGFARSIAARLFFGDGAAPRSSDEPALGWARLLREELPAAPSGAPPVEQLKTFGIVRGALLRFEGAPAGRRVSVTARLRTGANRVFEWRSFSVSDGRGAAVRVPFATGRNGEVEASPYVVSDGEGTREVSVSEEAVSLGREIVALPAAAATACGPSPSCAERRGDRGGADPRGPR